MARTATIVLLAFAVASSAQPGNYGGYSGSYGNYGGYSGSYGNYGGYSGSSSSQEEYEANEQTSGVFYDWGAHEGVNFFSVHGGRNSYIIDNDGKVLQEWEEPDGLPFGSHSEFTTEGTLLRGGRHFSPYFNDFFTTGGEVIREYNKDGECVWEFRYSTNMYRLNRAFEVLPNGNVVATAWQNHPIFDARLRGYTGEAQTMPDGFWSYTLVEVPRTGHENPDWVANNSHDDDIYNTCKYISDEHDIIWKWDSFDHTSDYINEYLYDINLDFKINDVEYYPERDHLMIVCDDCGEVFIIDHGLDFQKVPWNGHFIYRWGNPKNYGLKGDHLLGADNINWVQDRFGYDFKADQVGAVTIFNNDDPQEKEETSSIVQFTPPYDGKQYTKEKDGTFGPKDFDWKILKVEEQTQVKKSTSYSSYSSYSNSYSYTYEYDWFDFFSSPLSFAQEFPDKNLLVTSTAESITFEIAKGERAYWKYVSPFYNDFDRKHIDTPDEKIGSHDDLEVCQTAGGEGSCHQLMRIVRFSKHHSGVEALNLGP